MFGLKIHIKKPQAEQVQLEVQRHGSTQSFTLFRFNGRTRCAISCAQPFGWYPLHLYQTRFQPMARLSVSTVYRGIVPYDCIYYIMIQ